MALNLSSLSERQRQVDKLWSQLTFGSSENSRQLFDRHSANAFRLRDERLERQVHDEQEVDFHLGRRIADMSLWIEELEAKSDAINAQLDSLSIYITRLRNALATIPPILKTDLEILKAREGRVDVDLIVDEPQRCLLDELRIIKEQERTLLDLLETCEENGRLLRKFQYALSKRLEDRKKAKGIDSTVLSLSVHSTNLSGGEDMQRQRPRQIRYPIAEESTWEKINLDERTAAESILRRSDNLQTLVESTLRIFCESLQTAICQTNGAFEERLCNLKQTKAHLQAEHEKISISIRESEDLFDKLLKAREEKVSSLSLCETRIILRSQRPNFELVWDEVDKGLAKEESVLKWSIKSLNGELAGAKAMMKALLASQLKTEEQINVKLNSLAIDETQVLPARKSINVYQQ